MSALVIRDRPGAPPLPAPIRVAVLEADVSGADGRPDVALLATSVRTAMMNGVRERIGLELVPRTDIDSYVQNFKQSNGSRPGQRAIQTALFTGPSRSIKTVFDLRGSS